jgi:hypothetical protein
MVFKWLSSCRIRSLGKRSFSKAFEVLLSDDMIDKTQQLKGKHMKRFIASIALTIALVATFAFSTPTYAAGVNNNPWNYSFVAVRGRLITAPNPAFCNGRYFRCIPNFPRGIGYVIECHDGLYSKSGGRPGSCSGHRGNWQALYAH